jgi:hypothetical protein
VGTLDNDLWRDFLVGVGHTSAQATGEAVWAALTAEIDSRITSDVSGSARRILARPPVGTVSGIRETGIEEATASGESVRTRLAVLVSVAALAAVAASGILLIGVRRVQVRRLGGAWLGLDRWIFSAVLPVTLATGTALIAVLALPRTCPGPVSVPRFAAALVLCGVTAMVAIETVKRLLPLRAAYQRRQVALWLRERAGVAGEAAMAQLVEAMELAAAWALPGHRDRRRPAVTARGVARPGCGRGVQPAGGAADRTDQRGR